MSVTLSVQKLSWMTTPFVIKDVPLPGCPVIFPSKPGFNSINLLLTAPTCFSAGKAATSLEPVLKRLEDSEQAPELPESKMEVSVVLPACSEASEMLQPGECPLDSPTVPVV